MPEVCLMHHLIDVPTWLGSAKGTKTRFFGQFDRPRPWARFQNCLTRGPKMTQLFLMIGEQGPLWVSKVVSKVFKGIVFRGRVTQLSGQKWTQNQWSWWSGAANALGQPSKLDQERSTAARACLYCIPSGEIFMVDVLPNHLDQKDCFVKNYTEVY